jgi:hypothetical protein
MTGVRSIEACTQCQVDWYVDDEPAKCTDPDHDHQQFVLHQHLAVVVLPDGTKVTAASFDARDPYARVQPPDYGLYLDPQWEPPWSHDHLDWPDFGVPEDPLPVAVALRSLLKRARGRDRVEVGCLGGHGRTGTTLACLAIMSGCPPDDAIAWVRANYCTEAVETIQQEAFVAEFVG